MSKELAEEYASSLADLTVNSKPLINMLTILAEENIEHAGVIVETVEKHLEKVHPDIKLPLLYLVDSIIKNVGGAYTSKFSQSIVNMFTRTFKQVDEKIRFKMFKLRETWHGVFPATKLYQLDVKVNLIDPAWPIQAQPIQQSSIHVKPNFLKKPVNSSTTSTTVTPAPSIPPEEYEKMKSIFANKVQELLMLERKKVEMELEQMRRQVEIAEKTIPKKVPSIPATASNSSTVAAPEVTRVSVKQRLGPPVNKPAGRIAPVSAALVAARRDPRLARYQPPLAPAAPAPQVAVVAPAPPPAPLAPIASNVYDIKPLERVTKRKIEITIDVRPDVDKMPDAKKISKMPPIPKISRTSDPKRDGKAVLRKRKTRDACRTERRWLREEAQKEPTKEPGAVSNKIFLSVVVRAQTSVILDKMGMCV